MLLHYNKLEIMAMSSIVLNQTLEFSFNIEQFKCAGLTQEEVIQKKVLKIWMEEGNQLKEHM